MLVALAAAGWLSQAPAREHARQLAEREVLLVQLEQVGGVFIDPSTATDHLRTVCRVVNQLDASLIHYAEQTGGSYVPAISSAACRNPRMWRSV